MNYKTTNLNTYSKNITYVQYIHNIPYVYSITYISLTLIQSIAIAQHFVRNLLLLVKQNLF